MLRLALLQLIVERSPSGIGRRNAEVGRETRVGTTNRLRRGFRLCVVGAVALTTAVVSGGVAGAHVEIVPGSAPRGSLTVLALVVPNESESASTVRLELVFPAEPAVLATNLQPLEGWQGAVETERVTTRGQTVDVVRRIVWSGGTIGPGQFQQFYMRVAVPAVGKRLQLAAVQTYDDGEVVRWIEPTVADAPDPEYPAPVLRLTKPRTSGH